MKFQEFITCAALAVILSGVSSCSKGATEILDTIPADADVVALVNTPALSKECGVTFTAEGATFDPAMEAKMEKDVVEFCSLMGRLDSQDIAELDEVALFSTGAGKTFATFGIESFDKFREACGDRVMWGDNAEGMHVGSMKSRVWIVANDRQVWVTETQSPAKAVKEVLESAGKNPLGKVAGISRALQGNNMLNIAVISEKVGGDKNKAEAQESVWNVASLNSEDGKLTAEWCRMKGDGEKQPIKGMQPLNPAVLAYISADPVIAVAAGITPEFDWDIIGNLAMLSGDFQTQAMLATAIPYLASIDGTVMLAASPADAEAYTDIDPGSWMFTLMAHLPQEKINQLMQQVKTICFTSGITPQTDDKTGIMTIRQYGLNLHIGNVDGYLAVSNRPFTDTGENELAPLFVNKEGAARVAVPSLKPYGPGLPAWGLNLEASLAGTEGQATVTLPGANGPVLMNLLSIFL
ncbi:MAG: hypothetical protein NC039_03470 [Muribaculaceae bacterium]|nr:hypothetical protein [Muribaculaceae bacterium]